MQTTSKIIKCKVDSRWMWGLENACITVYSPSGGFIRMDKWHIGDASSELKDLVLKCVMASDESKTKEIELTLHEMQLLVTYPKAHIYKPKSSKFRR